jgi:hypothetical protein
MHVINPAPCIYVQDVSSVFLNKNLPWLFLIMNNEYLNMQPDFFVNLQWSASSVLK